MITHSSAVIAHGKKHYKYFRKLGLAKEKIFVTGSVSWITPTKKDYEMAEMLSNKFKGRKILYVGGLVERKGVKYLIEAFAKLVKENGDLHLWIVGDGPEKDPLIDLVKRLGLEGKITFFGWIDHSRVAPFYLAADVFVLPSWNEPWGLVINEAMSVGKPVITTYEVGSCLDLVKDGINGFIVPPKNSTALYNAMKKIISSESLTKDMGEKSLKIVKSYTYERMALGFLRAILYAFDVKEGREPKGAIRSC